ncbi:MAG: CotH kinase family protein [Bacillota bacterium]|jgi:spore coat protein CotH
MLNNKHTGIIIIILTAAAVCVCLAAAVFSEQTTDSESTGITQEYETALFNTAKPLKINIQMDENSWEKMLENATSEEYYTCDVEINGETFSDVGIRTKGNTSLSSIASDPETDRYSFKLEFDKYSDGQSCYGLDKLILNNNYADATNMKEAIVYDMYQYLGADASLYNYASIYINGEYRGVYLALEGVEESFLERNYGSLSGNLYKPDSMNMGNMGEGMTKPDKSSAEQSSATKTNESAPKQTENVPNKNGQSTEPPAIPNNNTADENSENSGPPAIPDDSSSPAAQNNQTDGPPAMPNDNGENFSSGGGSDLNYTDDSADSYSTIWEGSVSDTTDSDHKKVITALKNISTGNNLPEYMDIDNLLKYMAVHTFVVNLDSLSGNMSHNYYLYEDDGRLNIIPWDYNLAFGGMGGMGVGGNSDSASSVINYAIDSPFSGTEFFDALLENQEYADLYHQYLQQLTEEYVNGGQFEKTYNRIRSQIDSLVQKDPTAFYTYDEYTEAAEMLYNTVKLRAESVDGQLKGTVPSTDEAQKTQADALIDSSAIDLSVMGQMNMEGGGKNRVNSDQPNQTQKPS